MIEPRVSVAVLASAHEAAFGPAAPREIEPVPSTALQPALGHRFGDALICEACGVAHADHGARPRPCRAYRGRYEHAAASQRARRAREMERGAAERAERAAKARRMREIGLTLTQTAAALGVSRTSINRLLRGSSRATRVVEPDAETAALIAAGVRASRARRT